MGIKITLKTKTNKKAEELIRNLKNGGSVKVGWYEGQKEPNGLLVAENAYIQENGATIHFQTKTGKTATIYIPPRPFLLITINENKNKWQTVWKKLYKSVLDGKRTLKQALDLLGYIVKTDIQKTLRSNIQPELKKSTLKARERKGNYKIETLIDSKTMYDTINFESKVHK